MRPEVATLALIGLTLACVAVTIVSVVCVRLCRAVMSLQDRVRKLEGGR